MPPPPLVQNKQTKGNCLAELPESLAALAALEDLSVAGNRLARAPAALAALPALAKLALNGNGLEALPTDWSACARLKELHLQGNALRGALPEGFSAAALPALQELSLADNQIEALPSDLSGWSSLQKLHLYGNNLKQLPVDALMALPSLQQVWLEGNPLEPAAVDALLRRAADGALPPGLKAVGLDDAQVAGAAPALLAAARAARPRLLRIGSVTGAGPGYFKVQRGGGGGSSSSASTSSSGASTSGSSSGGGGGGGGGERVLVVAFGSAPGLPNWGGALRQVEAAMQADGQGGCAPMLFVGGGGICCSLSVGMANARTLTLSSSLPPLDRLERHPKKHHVRLPASTSNNPRRPP